MQPKSIDRTPEGIKIVWPDGHESPFTGDYLRQHCPCAVCKESSPLRKAPITIRSAQPMGWYALQFRFSDGHDTGIYSYELLRKLCPCPQCAQAN